jgi:hypothetical protein
MEESSTLSQETHDPIVLRGEDLELLAQMEERFAEVLREHVPVSLRDKYTAALIPFQLLVARALKDRGQL